VGTVHTFCEVKRPMIGGGGGVLLFVYNKDSKCVNAVYAVYDQKSILDR